MHIVSYGLKMLPNLVNNHTMMFVILLINTLSCIVITTAQAFYVL